MKKELRTVDAEHGICQLTTLDERFYAMPITDPATGLPRYEFRPSVTWITGFYPKGRGFETWLKQHGEAADDIRDAAADRGFIVHRAVAQLNAGEPVKMSDLFCDNDGQMRALTPDEYFAVMTYAEWWQKEGSKRFRILGFEYTIWPDADALAAEQGISAEHFQYAGTADLKLQELSTDETCIVDLKTSLDIWTSHEMQVEAYRVAERADKAAILQLNYRRNKTKKYKFTEVAPCFSLFIATKQIWKRECEGIVPLQRDYPLEIRL